jgi:hypothetical protein
MPGHHGARDAVDQLAHKTDPTPRTYHSHTRPYQQDRRSTSSQVQFQQAKNQVSVRGHHRTVTQQNPTPVSHIPSKPGPTIRLGICKMAAPSSQSQLTLLQARQEVTPQIRTYYVSLSCKRIAPTRKFHDSPLLLAKSPPLSDHQSHICRFSGTVRRTTLDAVENIRRLPVHMPSSCAGSRNRGSKVRAPKGKYPPRMQQRSTNLQSRHHTIRIEALARRPKEEVLGTAEKTRHGEDGRLVWRTHTPASPFCSILSCAFCISNESHLRNDPL